MEHEIIISDNNIHITDSYAVGHKDFKFILSVVKRDTPNEVTDNRSIYSLCCEWAVHNVLYKLGLFRSHTKDVDLNYPCKIGWLYVIVGTLCYPFA